MGQNLDFEQKQADSLYQNNQYAESASLFSYLYRNSDQNSDQSIGNAFLAGRSFQYAGNPDSAMVWYSYASEGFRKLRNWDNFHIAQGQLARILDDKGDYSAAIEITAKTLSYFKEQGDSIYAARTMNNLALYHYHTGEVQKAINLYYDAIELSGDLDDALKAQCFNQLGNIWAIDLNNEEKALENYQKSLRLKLQSSATARSIGFSYNNIGISHKNLGRLDSAMYYYRKALDYAILSNEPAAKLTPLINIANLYKRQGASESALNTYQQALIVAGSASIKQQVSLLTNIAMLFNELKNYVSAIDNLINAEELTEVTGILEDKRDIYVQKAISYNGLRDFERAYDEQLKVTALNDSLHRRTQDQHIADLMLKYESIQKDLALIEQQQIIQQGELDLRKRTIWLIVSAGLLLLVASILYFLFKRKELMAKQVRLELKLAEEKKRTQIQEERLRISRELHDNIGSHLTLINASVEQIPAMPLEKLNENLPQLQKLLSLSMRDLRKTVWLLNNQEITIDAFVLRLRDYFKPLNQNGTKISVQSMGETEQSLTDIQATHLFRIMQEAISNAYKHASAKNIQINFDVNKHIFFSIEDDGAGFDISEPQQGNGLRNMKLRMAELNGEMKFKSESGKGTTVEGYFVVDRIRKTAY